MKKQTTATADRVDRDAQAREEERIRREKEAIAEMSGSPAEEPEAGQREE